MATMKDIAKAVGVSLTTVSNVIHGNYDRVSPQTVARIQKAIEQMGYVPNMPARALVSHTSRIIAYVDSHSPQETYAGNGFAGVLLCGIENIVTEHGYFLMMRRGTDEEVLEQEIQVVTHDYDNAAPCRPTFTLTAFPAIGEGITYAVILDGGEARGSGESWTAALADLDRSAAGDVFLSTAEQLVLTGSAVTLLPEIVQSNALRPAAQVCFAPEAPPDPSEAADYLSAHEMDWTVQRVRTALLRREAVRLPVLAETEGGLRLYA